MLKFILLSIAATFLLYAINYVSSEDNAGVAPSVDSMLLPHSFNPIDKIVGDKCLDNNTLRPNNFDSIVNIHPKYLREYSDLYVVSQPAPEVYLLKRKAFFNQNRQYSLVVLADSAKIFKVIPFVDLYIRKMKMYKDKLYALRCDYSTNGMHWTYVYSIELCCFDLSMRPVWTVSTPNHKGYYLNGTDLKIVDNELLIDFEIQRGGSSTMCMDNYLVSFDLNASTKDVRFLGGYGCGPGDELDIQTIRSWFEVRLR